MQLKELFEQSDNTLSRMAPAAAVLHHKMEGFFWTGFYLLEKDRLLVGPYQGPLACQELEKDRGVCWAGINGKRTMIVGEVKKFPGHIACDPRSRSEIVVPVKDSRGNILGVLDIDSRITDFFNETDARQLERITCLLPAGSKR